MLLSGVYTPSASEPQQRLPSMAIKLSDNGGASRRISSTPLIISYLSTPLSIRQRAVCFGILFTIKKGKGAHSVSMRQVL